MSKSGQNNPNWRGGLIDKSCVVCAKPFQVKRANAGAKHCSLQCVGMAQRGRTLPKRRRIEKECASCGASFDVYACRANRLRSCSLECARKLRSSISSGEGNANWNGGISRLPYPHDFAKISRRIIERDHGICQNPNCAGDDRRMTTHHVNYDKQDCRDENLIALCSSCNSKANFGRARWQLLYADILSFRFKAVTAQAKKHGGGWSEEWF